MTTYRYTVLLDRGTTENVWIATIPTLPGCVTQGATIEQALERAQEAASGYVEALMDLGDPVPAEAEPWLVATVNVEIEPSSTAVLAGRAE